MPPSSGPKGALADPTAQVETEAEASLRPVATGRAGLLEQALEAARRETRTVVGDRHLEPATRCGTRLHGHPSGGVLERVADQVREHLGQVGGFTKGRWQSLAEVHLDREGALGVAVADDPHNTFQR